MGMLPWDLDLTWESKFHIRSESVGKLAKCFKIFFSSDRFQNRSREVWDLLCSSGEGAKVVEEISVFLMVMESPELSKLIRRCGIIIKKVKKGIWYRNNQDCPVLEGTGKV